MRLPLSSTSTSDAPDYALQIYNLAHLTLTGTIPIPNLLGAPSRLIHWGKDGLAIPTSSGDGAGALYFLQGTAFGLH